MKTVLITGSTGAIGNALALAFGEAGYHLLLHYRNREKLQPLLAQLEQRQIPFSLYQADLTQTGQCEEMFAKIKEEHSILDVLINNAGMTRDGLSLRMKEEDFDAVIDANLKSAFTMMKLASQMMVRQKYGKILSLSSIVGITGNVGQINYSAAKAGIIAMTKTLAKELGRKNIQVNAVAPGFIQSDMTKGLEDKYREYIPLNRLGEPAEVADLLVFLASEKCSYMTGQTIVIDGGLSL